MAKNKSKNILLRVNGELKDLVSESPDSPGVQVVLSDSAESDVLDVYRHTCSHLLAQAVMELYPDTQYGVGPALDNGFYYDFLTKEPFTPEDLDKISRKMKFLVKQKLKIERFEWTKEEALKYFADKNQDLKRELIEEKVEDDVVSVYKQGDFVDFCRGPHLPDTSFLMNFKLTSIASAYWKGDEKGHSMQRIYGFVFPDRESFDEHVRFLKEAKARDHRKLGKELDLFSIQNEIGAGLVLWHPKGSIMRHEIETFWKEEHLKNGYDLIYTPHIAKIDLWETSGHRGFYSDNMFTPIEFDNTEYQLKPMNCPFHIEVFKSKNRSYRDLPKKWAELGTVYRYERSGVLHGLMRVRGFTQDDAHLFCTAEQLDSEVEVLIDFSLKMLEQFGFKELEIYLSTKPEKYVGEDAEWEAATSALEKALKKCGVDYKEDPGEGVFYGPKIDIKVKDTLNRSWQCTTIQVDFNLPARFDLKYSDKDGSLQRPIMIHRALLGSLERFFGVLIEHFGGFFPVWLSPCQAIVLPLTERNHEYAEQVYASLKESGVRAEIDLRNEGVGRKIRDAEISKIPYIIVLGDEEEKNKLISYRIHKQGDQGKIELDKFIGGIKKNMAGKRLDYEI